MVDNTSMAALLIAIIAILGVIAVGYSFYIQEDKTVDLSVIETELVNLQVNQNLLSNKINNVRNELVSDINSINIDFDSDDLEDIEDDVDSIDEDIIDTIDCLEEFGENTGNFTEAQEDLLNCL